MDILTQKGKKSLKYEKNMLDIIRNATNNSFLFETNKDMPSKVDGVIIKNNELSGVFESKCRNMSIEELKKYGSWLVTFDKIMDGKVISKLLGVPYIGFLYLIKDKIVMYWKITDKYGNFLFEFSIKNTKTQKTINGGNIVRTNAFLPFDKGTILEYV